MKFQIKTRRTDEVLYECDLGDDIGDISHRPDLRDAVRKEIANGINLCDAYLCADDFACVHKIPLIRSIHQAVYQAASEYGALDMKFWHHACGTTHCRAGWVVTLAGEAGRVLEKEWGTDNAAVAIYTVSDPALEKIPDFFCDNAKALDDMKRLADMEASRRTR